LRGCANRRGDILTGYSQKCLFGGVSFSPFDGVCLAGLASLYVGMVASPSEMRQALFRAIFFSRNFMYGLASGSNVFDAVTGDWAGVS
jgi:hypothetical protein